MLQQMGAHNVVPPLRTRILDAAIEVVAESGWSGVTMIAVGERAGVSRQSVYNEIGSKPQLGQELIAREVAMFLSKVSEAIERESSPNAAIVAAASSVFTIARDNVLLSAALSPGLDAETELLPLLTTESTPIIQGASDVVVNSLSRNYSDVLPDEETLYAAVVLVVRLVLSYVIRPFGTPAQMAEQVGWVGSQLLAPVPVSSSDRGNLM